ncbi:hypothetical protein, partial [Pseudomonas sp. P15-2025]|uniref:hypothetical protein n=1 Tax=Pseudomonas sp. P15-2025 TaxID=3421170 RepID=UPI003FA242C3
NPPEGRKGDYAPPSRMNTYLMWMLTSKKQESRSKFVCFDSPNRPFAMATLTHLFALTASHFLSNATKSNQKTLRV